MDRAGLINKVKIKMDEFTPDGVSLPFDEYIGPLLDESARNVQQICPLHLLTPTAIPLVNGETQLSKFENNKSYIPVPADYVRLYALKYELWKKTVKRAVPVESPEYKIQDNEYLTGGYGRPFVAIVQTSIGGAAAGKYFECSKVVAPVSPSTLTPSIALYVKTAKPEELTDNLAEPLTWLTASKVFSVLGLSNQSKTTYEQYQISLNQLANS